jgi:hypothetical protein
MAEGIAAAWNPPMVVAPSEVASGGEALAEMNSEIAVALQAVAEVVEASIREIISKAATTIILASPQEVEEIGALAALRGQVASTSLTILKGNPWGDLVEVATQVSGARKIDRRQ